MEPSQIDKVIKPYFVVKDKTYSIIPFLLSNSSIVSNINSLGSFLFGEEVFLFPNSELQYTFYAFSCQHLFYFFYFFFTFFDIMKLWDAINRVYTDT